MALKVDLRVPVGLPVAETAAFIQRCEEAGFAGVGVHDHQHSGRDVYITLALAAERTSRLLLYPATSNPVTRHPMVLASLAHTLEELAPGRVRLVLGPGFLSVANIGHPRATLERMRHTITSLRQLLAGDSIPFGQTRSRLLNVTKPATPVYMTAAGPRMVELAGEIADGVMLLVGLHPQAIAAAHRRLEAGARRSGRDLRQFPIIFITPIALNSKEVDARSWPQRWLTHGHPWISYPSKANLHWLREAGIDIPDDIQPEQISDNLANQICDAFGLFGSPEECAERLRRAVDETGIDHVFLFPAHTADGTYDMPVREVDAFQRVIRAWMKT